MVVRSLLKWVRGAWPGNIATPPARCRRNFNWTPNWGALPFPTAVEMITVTGGYHGNSLI